MIYLGLRSGEITPKSLSASRPGSAMSTSTTNSVVNRRTTPVRKPRPLSIAGTGVTVKDGKIRKFLNIQIKLKF